MKALLVIPLTLWLICVILIIIARIRPTVSYGPWMLKRERKIAAVLLSIFAVFILIGGLNGLFNR